MNKEITAKQESFLFSYFYDFFDIPLRHSAWLTVLRQTQEIKEKLYSFRTATAD